MGTGVRRAAAGIALLAVAVGLLLGGGPAAAGPAEPVNVVVVMTDDQRVSDMSAMPQTRRLIGQQGTRFTSSFATFPLCCPSRVTFHTGLYAHNHGVTDNKPPNGGAGVFRDTGLIDDTTAVALQAQGYRTGLFGKYMNGYPALAKDLYVPPGYTQWAGVASAGRMYNWRQLIDDRIVKHGFDTSDYMTDVLSRQSARFIEASANKGQPFFVSVMPLAPHGETRFADSVKRNPRPAKRHRDAFVDDPLPRPPSFNERDVSDKPEGIRNRPRLDRAERQRVRRWNNDRRASLLAVDDLVARLVETLAESGELDNTLFVFTSDNGFLLGEHRLAITKARAYEESARVPLLVRGPGIPVGATVRVPVANIDLAPTIYDSTGVAPLLEQDGLSLLDIANDQWSYEDRELVIQTIDDVGLRTSDYLYVEHGTPATEFELYDLDTDRYQLESVHDDPSYAGERFQLAARLAALRDCEGEQCH